MSSTRRSHRRGYITSISLQALRQQIFDPGKPIDFDQGEALTFGAVSAGTGGLLYGAPGGIRIFANQRYLDSLPTIGRNNVLGYFGEAASGQQLLPFGPEEIITQRYVSNAAGKGSRTDILIDQPSTALRAIFPDAADPWRLGVIDVKTTDTSKEAYRLLTPNQQAVLVPLATSGGRMSGPLAAYLRWGTGEIAPGQASRLLVFRVGPGDFLRMPISLRRLLKTNTFEEILDGTAGTRNAERMASFLKTVTILVEPVK